MNLTCLTGTSIPTLETEDCDGVYTSSSCVVHTQAISQLSLPANFTMTQFINAMLLALTYKEQQIADLTDRIEALETP